MLAAGLDGMKRKISPPAPIEEDVYQLDEKGLEERNISTLPDSLGNAITEMEKDSIVKETFGKHTYPLYLEAKKMEWNEYRIHVSNWEIERYFEII